MKYTVIGQDGEKYGPADAEQIRQWIAQKRVDARTPIYVEGASEWTYAGLLPEFAAAFAVPATPVALTVSSAAVKPTNQLALWGLILGIASWICCCCGFPLSLVGLALSITGLMQINAKPEIQDGRALAIVGIVLCGTSLLWSIGFTLLNIIANLMNGDGNNGHVTWNFGSN